MTDHHDRPVGRWEWDIPADRITWNPALYVIYGLEQREFRPSYDTYVSRIHPEDRRRIDMIVRQAVRDCKPFDYDHRLVWPDGSVRVVRCHGEVVCGLDGRPVRMWGTSIDITEQGGAA
jgi:PAS domain-containing protein